MNNTFAPILPHGPLTEIADGIWTVTGSLPGRKMTRKMVIHRLRDGGLLIHSAIAMDENGMRDLESLGRPTVMIVPNGFHRMDAARYKARYPSIQVLCPEAARARVEKIIKVDATCETGLAAHGITWLAPAGLKAAELIYELPSSLGVVLVTTDLLMNIDRLPGIEGLMLKLFGPGRGFGVTRISKILLMKDKASFREWLMTLGDRKDLGRLVVAHGEDVTNDVGERLRQAACRL